MRCACGKENPDSAARCQQCGRPSARPRDLRRWAIDVAVAVGLIAALAVVWMLDPGAAPPQAAALKTEVVEQPGATGEDGQTPLARRALRLAATPPEHDDMGKLLATLGR